MLFPPCLLLSLFLLSTRIRWEVYWIPSATTHMSGMLLLHGLRGITLCLSRVSLLFLLIRSRKTENCYVLFCSSDRSGKLCPWTRSYYRFSHNLNSKITTKSDAIADGMISFKSCERKYTVIFGWSISKLYMYNRYSIYKAFYQLTYFNNINNNMSVLQQLYY